MFENNEPRNTYGPAQTARTLAPVHNEPRNTYGPTQTARTLAPVHNEKFALFTNTSKVPKESTNMVEHVANMWVK
jgi:hypothetical protein